MKNSSLKPEKPQKTDSKELENSPDNIDTNIDAELDDWALFIASIILKQMNQPCQPD